jgi:hypothetical protein
MEAVAREENPSGFSFLGTSSAESTDISSKVTWRIYQVEASITEKVQSFFERSKLSPLVRLRE